MWWRRTLILLIIAGSLMALTILGFYLWSHGIIKNQIDAMGNSVVETVEKQAVKIVQNQISNTTSTVESSLVEEALGFQTPKIYLILFLNNTELRPGGGFIGSYAVVKMDKGIPSIIKVEGTEVLDNSAPKDYSMVAPAPISQYLKVSNWYFRDSNWYPDFALSAEKALEFYKMEKGTEADNIDYVVGFTPTVIEDLLKITGPISANGEEFNSDNFTEKLEYEVEYGYSSHGLEYSNRKQTLSDLVHAFEAKLATDVFSHWGNYLDLGKKMVEEKQVAAYAVDLQMEQVAVDKGWAQEMKKNDDDYLLWADANLGSLKTDLVMKRDLTYTISQSKGRFIGQVDMKLANQGKLDWRTVRYQDYARVYLPQGSELIAAYENNVKISAKSVDAGIESGKQWFGTSTVVPLGKSKDILFKFYLSDNVVNEIKNGSYNLIAQKQIGTMEPSLSLDLDFGKGIASAEPAENPSNFGDTKYTISTNLLTDRQFQVNLGK